MDTRGVGPLKPGQANLQKIGSGKEKFSKLDVADTFTSDENQRDKQVDMAEAARTLLSRPKEEKPFRWFVSSHLADQVQLSPDMSAVFIMSSGVKAVDVDSGRELWKNKDLLTGYSVGYQDLPTWDDATVFAHGRGFVTALDGKTGKEKWKFEYPKWKNPAGGSEAPLLSEKGVVVSGEWDVINMERNRVYGIDARTGKKKWEFHLKGKRAFSPLLAGKSSVISGKKNGSTITVYNLDVETGKKNWEKELPFSKESYQTTDEDGNFYFAIGNQLRVFDKSGNEKKIELDGTVKRFSESNSDVLLIHSKNKIFVLDRKKMDIKFEIDRVAWSSDAKLGPDGNIYINRMNKNGSSTLTAVDGKTGKEIWYRGGGPLSRFDVNSQGEIYVSKRNGEIFQVDPRTGKDKGKFVLDTDRYGDISRILALDDETSSVVAITWKGAALFRKKKLTPKVEIDETKTDSKNRTIEQGEDYVEIGGVRLKVNKKRKGNDS